MFRKVKKVGKLKEVVKKRAMIDKLLSVFETALEVKEAEEALLGFPQMDIKVSHYLEEEVQDADEIPEDQKEELTGI